MPGYAGHDETAAAFPLQRTQLFINNLRKGLPLFSEGETFT